MLIRRKSEQTQTAPAAQKKSQPQTAAIPQQSPPPPPPPPPQSHCSSDEEEYEFESKPIIDPTKSTTAKRRAEDDAATKYAKKPKKIAGKKHNFFQRLWSEEDEIVILKGLIDYTSNEKSDSVSDLKDFHDFIKKNLLIDFTRVQLHNKIRKMKMKYVKNKSKEKEEGKERSFPKSHDQRAFDLSKIIWGDESGKESDVRNAAAAESERVEDVENAAAEESEEVKDAVVVEGGGEGEKLAAAAAGKRVMSVEERMLIGGREVYEVGGEGVEGEEEWQKLRVEELELYQKEMEVRAAQMKVRAAQTKLVLDAIKGGTKVHGRGGERKRKADIELGFDKLRGRDDEPPPPEMPIWDAAENPVARADAEEVETQVDNYLKSLSEKDLMARIERNRKVLRTCCFVDGGEKLRASLKRMEAELLRRSLDKVGVF